MTAWSASTLWRWTRRWWRPAAHLPGNACRMDDRVHIYFENALKYIRRCEEERDRLVADLTPSAGLEGLFTREFYGSCFNAPER